MYKPSIVLVMQDMRVQAFKCSLEDATLSTQAQQPDAAVDTCPVTSPPEARPNGTATSNGWLSRTAALIDSSKPHSDTAAATPANCITTAPSSNIFNSPDKIAGNSTDTLKQSVPNGKPPSGKNGQACNGHVGSDTGLLVGSSAMADSHCGVVIALALCGEYVCSAGGDAMIKVWKADSLEFCRYAVLCSVWCEPQSGCVNHLAAVFGRDWF